jgi:hypothetical protein
MELIVEFRGGPCDGLACSSESADLIAAATAIVWSLLALGRPTAAMFPGSLADLRQAPVRGRRRTAVYEVAQRTLKPQSMTSIAVYCARVDLARDKRQEIYDPAMSMPLES